VLTEREFLDSIAYLSRPVRARRIREAAAELLAMRSLPPLTGDDALLAMKVAFGLLPATALILPEHRMLSPFHLLAITARGAPMARAVCRAVGRFWLRSVEALQREQGATAAAPTV